MKQIIKIFTLSLFGILVFSINSFSEKIEVNGKIKGANCVINKAYCVEDGSDPHIALENAFVLVEDNGEYYFLSNLGRINKLALLNKTIHVKGKKNGKSILVDSVHHVDNNIIMSKVWDWGELKKKFNNNN